MELETHLLLAHRIKLLDQESLTPLLPMTDEVSRMLSGLRRALEAKLRTAGEWRGESTRGAMTA